MSDIISLDIETSSDSLDGKLLSIGVVRYGTVKKDQLKRDFENTHFYAQAKFPKGVFMKPEAMLVNKLTHEELSDDKNPTLEELDVELCRWLDKGSIMMGRGAAYFDMPFVRRDLPKSYAKFSRRIFDITPLFHTLSLLLGQNFEKVRRKCLQYADTETLKVVPNLVQHHALYDAYSNCFALDYLLRAFSKMTERSSEYNVNIEKALAAAGR